MSSVKFSLIAAAAAVTFASGARAADLPAPAPAVYAPVQEFSGWYLRGDIGMTNQQVKSADNALIATTPNFMWLDTMSFDSGMLFGLGVGYNFNSWLRVDVTGEYRGKTSLHGLDQFLNGSATNTNNYSGTKSEWLFLANAYVDLGTWWCITPFIGAGVGVANIKIDNFRDDNIIAGGGGYAPAGTKTNFAWALHAGLGYQVTKNFTVELAYRYVDLGDGVTGDVVNYDGTNFSNNPWTFNHITSHDVKFGMRWTCCEEPVPQPATYAPLMRKG
ncbi:MAG TPA: outer membrane beta-barrel protein [Pseudorhodoplanes sp.]|jgi:opacity protein-like surface antigen|nr:outer membrane beta-barrel protein [Pseudorhodoplanes sp.]